MIEGVVKGSEIKTLVDFMLYGEPSPRYFTGGVNSNKSFLIEIPDISAMVLEKIDVAFKEIKIQLESYIKEKHPERLLVKPKDYSRFNSNEMIFHYRKSGNEVKMLCL